MQAEDRPIDYLDDQRKQGSGARARDRGHRVLAPGRLFIQPTGRTPAIRSIISIPRRTRSRSTSFRDHLVIEPAIAVAHDLVPALDEGTG
jgi:hypothetical protein